jgi:hypothetical protein
MKLLLVLVLTLILVPSAFATVTVSKVDCPIQFEGRVKEIVHSVGPNSAFALQSVIFENIKTLKGEVSSQPVVELLENGPFKLLEGEVYLVQLRQGRVCWIDVIEQ